jgi:hypothetical protein
MPFAEELTMKLISCPNIINAPLQGAMHAGIYSHSKFVVNNIKTKSQK